MKKLYDATTYECSKIITQRYSTSFTLGIKTLHKRFHMPIYAIYGYVRYADEIVDTFHDYDKESLLNRFREDTYRALDEGVSTNPVLHAFQLVVNEFSIERELIDAFLHSMEMDLHKQTYNEGSYEEYIYGSAEVVGLMCLRVFLEGDEARYQALKGPAKRLGAAFQKVNFLRDIKSDFQERGRVYFPGVDLQHFNREAKLQIEADIEEDFRVAYEEGIRKLPRSARFGVYLAYVYYIQLFKKIKRLPATRILNERVRIPNQRKFALMVGTYFRHRLNYL